MSLTLQLFFVAAFVFIMILMGSNLKKRRKKILFFGDSITEYGSRPGGYIARISEYLSDESLDEKTEIITSGRGGDKVYDLYLRMNEDVLLREPHVVVLFVGVNDIWHKQKHGTGTNLDTFCKFYENLLQQLTHTNTKVIVCTPAVIGENALENEDEWKDLQEYGTAIKALAETYEVPVIDLHHAFKKYYADNNIIGIDEGVLTTDGVHLNVEGNRLVAQEVYKLLRPLV